MQNVTVRPSRPGDELELARLAVLDSGTPPRGPALIAEADARIVAALPLGSGRLLADPFEPTAELVALLELRKEQLRAGDGAPRLGRRIRSILRVPPSHARAQP